MSTLTLTQDEHAAILAEGKNLVVHDAGPPPVVVEGELIGLATADGPLSLLGLDPVEAVIETSSYPPHTRVRLTHEQARQLGPHLYRRVRITIEPVEGA